MSAYRATENSYWQSADVSSTICWIDRLHIKSMADIQLIKIPLSLQSGRLLVGAITGYLANSQAWAKANANLYILIETAKANNLYINDYLTHAFKESPNAKSIEEIEALIPWNTMRE